MSDIMKSNLEAIYTASMIAHQNAVVISPPGFGKTKMSYHMGRQVVGDDLIFLDLSPSTPPERISGPVDLLALKEGRMQFNVTGTPYDPKAKVIILDEFWRSNEIVFDMLIHATNDIQRGLRSPVYWATSNFVVKSVRTEALRDRFALWYIFEPAGVDIGAIVHSTDISEWKFDLPTLKEAEEIRSAPYTENARKAITQTLELLVEAIGSEGFIVNHRRVEAWRELLFRSAIYHGGNNSFKTTPDEAVKILKYAYPAVDAVEMRKWQTVAASIIDAVGTAVEQYMALAREKFNQVINSRNPNERMAFMAELGKVLADSEEELRRIGGNTKIAKDAIITFNAWFQQAAKGKTV